MQCSPEKNIYLVNKPSRISSFQFISQIKKKFSLKKIGHAGTLDPLASGLLIIGVNEGTKKLSSYLSFDKRYEAGILLGESRDTGDREGKVIEFKKYKKDLNEEKIISALLSLQKEKKFPAPLYSAVKVKGKPLYWYMRKNKKAPYIPMKKFELKEFKLLFMKEREDFLEIYLSLLVGSGTYIRTLGEELGKLLKYPSHLFSLKRKQIGPFSLEDSCDIDSLRIFEN